MSENNHYNILLVEDNAHNVIAATAFLDSLGYSYVVAINGIQAVKTFVEGTFDLILMDIQMPSMSGFETAELIRAIEKRLGIRTPIIAMTAHMYRADTSKLIEIDLDDFIPKPFHPEYFSSTIGKYCQVQTL